MLPPPLQFCCLCISAACALPLPVRFRCLCTSAACALPLPVRFHHLCAFAASAIPLPLHFHCLCASAASVLPLPLHFCGLYESAILQKSIFLSTALHCSHATHSINQRFETTQTKIRLGNPFHQISIPTTSRDIYYALRAQVERALAASTLTSIVDCRQHAHVRSKRCS